MQVEFPEQFPFNHLVDHKRRVMDIAGAIFNIFIGYWALRVVCEALGLFCRFNYSGGHVNDMSRKPTLSNLDEEMN